MNEKIKLLAEQAGVVFWEMSGDVDWRQTDRETLEKFAELIVRECANTAYQSLYEDKVFDNSPHNIRCNVMDAIKKHFGVEK